MRHAIATALLVAGACSGGEPIAPDAGPFARGTAVVGGRIVSTVDGRPIDLATVEHAARAAGVAPRVALRRLQDEELVAGAAARAGLGADPEVERAVRRASVQAWLVRTVEEEVTDGELDPALHEAAYEAAPDRFARPERRRSVHAVAQLAVGAPTTASDAAEAWIRALYVELEAAADPESALLAVRRRPLADLAFAVVVEEVPPIARTDGAEPAYLEALFEVVEPGLVPHVVRSEQGWHAVVVTEITPAWRATREEALATLAAEALAARRARRLEEHVRQLARATGVTLEPSAVDRVLRDPALFGGRE